MTTTARQWNRPGVTLVESSLIRKGVRDAGQKEMNYIDHKKLWRKATREEAVATGCNIVGGRWIDVDKGDAYRPEYRSRFVTKEINTGPEEGLFASTPPLEALRWLLSEASTVEYNWEQGVRRAGDVHGVAGSSAGGDWTRGQRRTDDVHGAAGSGAGGDMSEV